MVVGPILLLLVMFVIGPIAVFVAGAIWSGLSGWVLSENAVAPAEADESATAATH